MKSLLTILLFSGVLSCNLPPALWCDTAEIAEQCGASAACAKWHNQNTQYTVTLLYEALCGECQKFITGQLYQMIYKELYRRQKIVKQEIALNLFSNSRIKVVPWGNTRRLSNDTIRCQHGPQECLGNKITSCVLYFARMKVSRQMEFVNCFELTLQKQQEINVQTAKHFCFTSLAFSERLQEKIDRCTQGSMGERLQSQDEHITNAIQPVKHRFAPWVVINGYSLNSTQVAYIGEQINLWHDQQRGVFSPSE